MCSLPWRGPSQCSTYTLWWNFWKRSEAKKKVLYSRRELKLHTHTHTPCKLSPEEMLWELKPEGRAFCFALLVAARNEAKSHSLKRASAWGWRTRFWGLYSWVAVGSTRSTPQHDYLERLLACPSLTFHHWHSGKAAGGAREGTCQGYLAADLVVFHGWVYYANILQCSTQRSCKSLWIYIKVILPINKYTLLHKFIQ